MTAAIYIRVSTSKKTDATYQQNPGMQLEPLNRLARERSWEVFRVYEDRMSGANPNRPEFRRMLEDARRGRFKVILVWKFDRFARSLQDLINALEELNALGVRLVSYTEAIDTSTPAGKALFQTAGVFAEFERSLVIERVNAGIQYARENGTKSGKAIGRPKAVVRRDEIREMKDAGVPVRQIARRFKIGIGTVYRACSETPPENRGIAEASTGLAGSL